jgi:hypothetical protein
VQETVNQLDYHRVRGDLAGRMASLGSLVGAIDLFLGE